MAVGVIASLWDLNSLSVYKDVQSFSEGFVEEAFFFV